MGKIFGIGLKRTGNASLCRMMKRLGFSTLHLPSSILEIEQHDFSSDITVSGHFEELDLQFPDSKFVYTCRDRKSWVQSMRKWLARVSRQTWFHALPDDETRRWISQSNYRLYSYPFLEMADITDTQLIAAYDRHATLIRDYFSKRQGDLLTIDLTDASALPYAKLVRFLETNHLISVPWGDWRQVRDSALQKKHAPQEADRAEEIQYKLSKVWLRRGKKDRAEAGFRKTLRLNPNRVSAMIELGILLIDKGQYHEAEAFFKHAGLEAPNDARCHKGLLSSLSGQNALEKAFDYYQLEKRDHNTVDIKPHHILCCTVIRNEVDRLPHFLEYYRQLGVDRFFFVDNASTDGSIDYLLDQADVHVWESPLSFNKANFGAGWFEVLLRSYGRGQWVLIVDADELLVYPECESQCLPELCRELDSDGKRVLEAILLDMYSDKPISETHYRPGQRFVDVCPYFDRHFYHLRVDAGGPFKNMVGYFGGPRQRVFGPEGNYCLSKAPLIKYDTDCLLIGGQHWTSLPTNVIAGRSGCLLHFKYFDTFKPYVDEQVDREQHYDGAMQYKLYHSGLEDNPELSFFDTLQSVRFKDSWQLIDLGVMRMGRS